MSNRESDAGSDDGIVSEDVTQHVEHIELTGEAPLLDGPGWELATPAEDLDDGPIQVGDAIPVFPVFDGTQDAVDMEMFTATEIDLNRRLQEVEGEELELAVALGVERARWEKRVAAMQSDLAERNEQLAERESEIEDLAAQLASMTLARDGHFAELHELRQSSGHAEPAALLQAVAPMEAAIASLRERLHERGRALREARLEVNRLRTECARLNADLAERGALIERLQEKLKELEAGRKDSDELRRSMRRADAGRRLTKPAPVAESTDADQTALLEGPPSPGAVIEEPPQARPGVETATAIQAGPGLRRYLIGLDLVGCVHEIVRPRISVGRTQDNDLRIMDPTVSRLHAMLNAQGRAVTVIDANSRNGVYVNGIQVRHAKLADGDLLTFGTVRFRYRIGSGSPDGGSKPT